jgi:hypothetical protein
MNIKPTLSLRGAQRQSNPHRISLGGGRLLRFARNDGKPSLALLSAVTALAFCALHMVVPALPSCSSGVR